MKRRKKHQNHGINTAHGTTADFLFAVGKTIFRPFIFTTQKLPHIRVARTKSPQCTHAVNVLMGMPLIHGSPPQRGENEPSPVGRLPTLRFSSCGQAHSFHYHQVHLICPQAVRCWMVGFRSCATPLGTSRRGTLYCVFLRKISLRSRAIITRARQEV